MKNISGVLYANVDTSTMYAKVLFDNEKTDVRQMESELNNNGYEVQDVVETVDTGLRPTAVAGTDVEAKEGETVVLDGSGSASENGNIILYVWHQTVGIPIIESGFEGKTFSFNAPSVGPSGEVLKFALYVEDAAGICETDETTITVLDNGDASQASPTPNSNESSGGDGGGGCFINVLK